MQKSELEQTNRLLRVIVALLIKDKQSEQYTGREQISLLRDLGLQPKEISDILGKSNTYVNKELSHLKKIKSK